MEERENKFTPEDSLLLIRSMIETTKESISDNSHYFLVWGWATMIGCALQYYLLAIANYPRHYYAWLITPVAAVVHVLMILRDRKKENVRTFISEANSYVWTIIGFSFMSLSFVFTKFGWQYCFPIYIMLYAIGTYISGSLIKFQPMKIGAIICMVLVAIAPYLQYDLQILLTAFAILISYIIPGHMLRNKYKKAKRLNYAG